MVDLYTKYCDEYEDLRRAGQIYLSEYLDYMQLQPMTDTPMEKYRGLVVSLEEAGVSGLMTPFVLSSQAQELVNSALAKINEKIQGSQIFLPLEYLSGAFGLDDTDKIIVAIAYFCAIDNGFSKQISYINNDVSRHFLVFSACVKIFFGGNSEKFLAKVRKKYIYIFDFDTQDIDFSLCELKLSKRIFDVLSGEKILTQTQFSKTISVNSSFDEIYGRREELRLCNEIFNLGQRNVMVLLGKKGSGRKFLFTHLCKEKKHNALFVDFNSVSDKDVHKCVDDICREILLQKALCIITNVTSQTELPKLMAVLNGLTRKIGTLAVESEIRFEADDIENVHFIKLSELNFEDRLKIWENKGRFDENVILEEINEKYRFSPAQICMVLKKCELYCKIEGKELISDEMIEKASLEMSEGILEGKAQRIETGYTLSDLILPDEEKRQITEGIDHIKFKHKVLDSWGFSKKISYGRGLSMLFEGSPGTGKTMAASIISNELGLPVFKIDISKMISKYIGETEKSLGEVFDTAQQNNAILFFDETDALFGKRSEIKDSHDKYANIETSYLLQKMEEYDGIVIMTTNFLQNIDEAFLRRINYIIHFPFPDSERRILLWKSVFPSQAEVSGDVDFEFLANQFEMSGAMIKSTAVSAAFLAAAENREITMRDILRAVTKQFSKFGKNISADDLGPYAIYL